MMDVSVDHANGDPTTVIDENGSGKKKSARKAPKPDNVDEPSGLVAFASEVLDDVVKADEAVVAYSVVQAMEEAAAGAEVDQSEASIVVKKLDKTKWTTEEVDVCFSTDVNLMTCERLA